MSRIEVAMEKAALLRQGVEGPTVLDPPEPPRQESRPVTPPAPAMTPQAPAMASHKFTNNVRPLKPGNPLLATLHEPHSPTAEEYRKLKSALVKITTEQGFKNTIAVTSSLPSEGKSLTALNLAISLAQQLDHTVLLIDADLRRPSLHRYLDMESGPGFADVLVGEAGIAETLVPTGIGKLSVMRAGRYVENPAELVSSHRMKELLHEMKSRYPDRYLIFDTPPVLPFAESRSLAHLVDGVLFVVMERLAPQESVRDALDSLKGCGMLGLVYNAATLSGSDERYSYYHSYNR